jgi:tRNA-specific 2-thiouridylase
LLTQLNPNAASISLCICNKYIKFDVFYKHAQTLGADFIATGHYARLNQQGELLKGLDPNKDQTYFLHQVNKEVFKDVLFPIGDLLKPDLRQLARTIGLPTADGNSAG